MFVFICVFVIVCVLAGMILRHASVLLFVLCFCILFYSSSGVSGPAVAIAPAAVQAIAPVAVLTVAAAIALVCCYVTLLLLLLHAFVLSNYKLSRGHPSIQNYSKLISCK